MKYVTFDITNKCNLRCKHCYNRNKYFFKDKYPTLNEEEIKSIISKLKTEGCEYINFLGGEPLIRNDFINIVNYCKLKGIKTLFTTNGILLSQEKYKELIEAGIESIDISLEGTEKENDFIRGKGTYKKVINNIKAIKENFGNIDKLRISYTLTSYNYTGLFEFIRNLNVLGVKNFLIGSYINIDDNEFDTFDLNKNFKTFKIFDTIEEVIRKLSKSKLELNIELDFRPMFVYYLRNTYGKIVHNNVLFSNCAYKKGLRYIEADGRVHPCNVYSMENLKGFDKTSYLDINCNIMDTNYNKDWARLQKCFSDMYEKEKKINNICKKCTFLQICEPCPFQFKDDNNYMECKYVKYKINQYKDNNNIKMEDFNYNEYIKSLFSNQKGMDTWKNLD